MTLNTEQYIDFYNTTYTVFYAEQYDSNSRTITLIPTNGGQILELDTSWVATVLYCKPDGRICFNAATIDHINNQITVTLTEQMLVSAGKAYAQICLCDPINKKIITSTTFYVQINSAVEGRNTIVTESEDVIDAFNELYQTVMDMYINATNVVISIKGEAEDSFRAGEEIVITKANLGLGNVDNLSLEDIRNAIAIFTAEKNGLVPAYANSDKGKYLTTDGWAELPVATNTSSGIMSLSDYSKFSNTNQIIWDADISTDTAQTSIIINNNLKAGDTVMVARNI